MIFKQVQIFMRRMPEYHRWMFALPFGRLNLPLLLLSLVAMQGCAMFQRNDLSRFPEASRTLYLYNFTNSTFQPEVHIQLNEILKSEIERRHNFILKYTAAEAQFTVEGDLNVYRMEGRLYDDYRNATRYQLIVGTNMQMRGKSPGAKSTTGYFTDTIGASVDFSTGEGFSEDEYRARERVLRILAARICNALEAHFLSSRPSG